MAASASATTGTAWLERVRAYAPLAATQSPNVRRLSVVAGVVAGPWIMALFESLILGRVMSGTFGNEAVDMVTVARVYLVFVLTNFALVFSAMLFESAQTLSMRPWLGRVGRGLSVWWLIIAVLGTALAWAEIAYPQIPSYLGGGRPELVRLVTGR